MNNSNGKDIGRRALATPDGEGRGEPIKMVLFCPACGVQHIDEPDEPLSFNAGSNSIEPDDDEPWSNPPHRSHLCHGCGYIWRPADVPTEGVLKIETVGKSDSRLSKADTCLAALASRGGGEKKGGYAPGNYECRCHKCGWTFTGDKLAVTCLSCATERRSPAPLAPDLGGEAVAPDRVQNYLVRSGVHRDIIRGVAALLASRAPGLSGPVQAGQGSGDGT